MIYIDLILNLTLLVALSIVSGFAEKRYPRGARMSGLLQGLIFGSAAVIGMLRPVNLGAGLIFDGRSVMVSLCALFFGPLAAAVSGAMTIACRLWLGGAGMLTGSLVILSSVGIGLWGYARYHPDIQPLSVQRLYLFGLAVHGAMLALMLTLPQGAGLAVLKTIGLPVILLFPLATVLAGKILADQVAARRALQALRDSEARLRALGDNLPNSYVYQYTFGANGAPQFLYISAGVQRVHGVSAEEALRDAGLLMRQIAPEDQPRRAEAEMASLQAMTVFDVTVRTCRADGAWRWLRLRSSPRREPDGRVIWDGVAVDVTEQAQAEQDLRASVAFAQTLIDAIPVPIFYRDANSRFLGCNQAHAAFRGVSREAIVGKTVYETSPPELAALYAQRDRALIEQGGTQLIETEAVRADGSRRHVIVHRALFDNAVSGERGVVGAILDITEQKQAEVALRESEARARRLLQQQLAINQLALALGEALTLPEVYQTIHRHIAELMEVWCFIVSAYDEEAQLIRAEYAASEDEVFDASTFPPIPLAEPGRGTQSQVIHSGQPLYTPDHRQALEGSQQRYIIEEGGAIHPEQLLEEEHTDTTRSVVYVPMKVKGRAIGVMQVQSRRLDAYREQDIELLAGMANVAAVAVQNARLREDVLRELAMRERLQEQLVQAQKQEAIGRLAGGVAHDFNNMLSVILGNAELALIGLTPPQPLYEELTEIKKAAERSADLTRQLLGFARQQTIIPRELDLNETVEGMLKMLRRLIGEDIDLAWLPGAHLWPLKMDPTQLWQILANLCVNARDAIAGVGKVTIETENVTLDAAYCAEHAEATPGEYVVLAVSDDGSGMDKATMARLFEPFFTTKGVGQGTGLGLATVYGIVKQNNGLINVYSEVGQGATFRIYLPRHIAEGAEGAVRESIREARGGNETVLLVEDEGAVLALGRAILQRLGYKVVAARSPVEALEWVREHDEGIDLLLTDVVMPGMSGRELAERLRGIRPGLKCLFTSGYTANAIAHRGVLAEGVQFIQKPFSTESLAAKVREALES